MNAFLEPKWNCDVTIIVSFYSKRPKSFIYVVLTYYGNTTHSPAHMIEKKSIMVNRAWTIVAQNPSKRITAGIITGGKKLLPLTFITFLIQ